MRISAISITPQRIDDNPGVAFIKYNDDTLALILPTALVTGDPALQNPATALERLNELAETDLTLTQVLTTIGSRQSDILNGVPAPGQDDPYQFLEAEEVITLQQGLTALAANQNRSFFTDEATARDLIARNLPELAGFTVIAPVAFDEAAFPGQVSQGLGIVVKSDCCQLFADIKQAIVDMEAEGVLPALRAEFQTGNFTPLNSDALTPEACRNTQPNINSNRTANFIFTKFCQEDLLID